jgi:hypothetical protein
MKAPENPRSRPARIARTAGFAVAAIAYLGFLVIAGADPGPLGSEPSQSPSQVEIAAHLP